jgi:SAM-dependent methyltransferase
VSAYWQFLWTAAAILVVVVCLCVGWRWASRRWQLPYPSLFGWVLESELYKRLSGTSTTLDRLGLRTGQRILEIGPGPGRLLIPAAMQVEPDGEAVGIDIQPRMVDRLQQRAEQAGLTNLTVILGDATEPHVDQDSFDLVFLAMTLGEIPDREAALAESYRALKPGGVLSVTEIFGDPHYQSRSSVKRLAERAGFEFRSLQGDWWFFTETFVKPVQPS